MHYWEINTIIKRIFQIYDGPSTSVTSINVIYRADIDVIKTNIADIDVIKTNNVAASFGL